MGRDYLLGHAGTDQPLHKIMLEVCVKHGLTPVQMLSNRRGRDVSLPRHEAIYRCAQETGASYPEIGRVFNRDHTTVVHAIKRHAARVNGTVYSRKRYPKHNFACEQAA